jgi:hypothetical protein
VIILVELYWCVLRILVLKCPKVLRCSWLKHKATQQSLPEELLAPASPGAVRASPWS